jgi:transcription elongation factor/antiterminator RfaH
MKWYAVYTKSRAEKRVNDQLAEKGIEAYLPLVKTLRQWSDRRKFVQIPLFPGYVFVKANRTNRLDVLSTEGLVSFVKIGKEEVPIPQKQIDAIKHFLLDEDQQHDMESFIPGSKVEVMYGSLKGLEGLITKVKGKNRLEINVLAINQSFTISIPASHLKLST